MILIAKNETGLQVSVFFKHDDLFNSIQTDTIRRIRTIVQNAEEIDTLKITPSDKKWYDENIQEITDKLYTIISAYIKGDETGYNPNVTITENAIDIGKHVTYMMFIPDYDINNKNELENQMYKFIKTGIITQWYKELNHSILFQIFDEEMKICGDKIHSLLLKRIHPIRRSMSHFN